MAGPFAAHLDRLFENQVADTYVQSSMKERDPRYRRDIPAFVDLYKLDGLFDYQPGRQHKAYPGYRHQEDIPSVAKLKGHLVKYSKDIDIDRRIVCN